MNNPGCNPGGGAAALRAGCARAIPRGEPAVKEGEEDVPRGTETMIND